MSIDAKLNVDVKVSGADALGGVGKAGETAARGVRSLEQELVRVRAQVAQRAITAQARSILGVDTRAARSEVRSVTQEMERLQRVSAQRANTNAAREALGMTERSGGFASGARGALALARDVAGGYYLISHAAHLAAGAVESVVEPYRDYQRLLTEAQSKQNFSAEQFKAIDQAARGLGRSTVFKPTEAAEAAVQLAAAGVHGEEIPHALRPSLMLAQATHLSTEESTHSLIQAATQFQIPITNLTRVGDVFAKASTSATTNIHEITEALNYVGPVANAAGFSLEKTAAMIDVLAEGGLKGSVAGTGLARVMVNLSKPTKQAREALATLHMSVKDTQAGLTDPQKFFEKLGHATEKYSKAQRLALFNTLFGARGQVVALELSNAALRNNGTLWNTLNDKMEHAGGTMDRVADQMGNTLDGRIKKLNARLEEAKIRLAEGFAPALEKAASAAAPLVTRLSELAADHSEGIATGLEGAAIGGGVLLAGKAGGAIGALIESFAGAGALSAVTAAGTTIGVTLGAAIAAALTGYGLGSVIAKSLGIGEEQTVQGTRGIGLESKTELTPAELIELNRRKGAGYNPAGSGPLSNEAWAAAGGMAPTNPEQGVKLGPAVSPFNGQLEILITSEGKPKVMDLNTKGAPLQVGVNVR